MHQIGTYSAHGIKPGANGTAFAKINQDRGLITYPFNKSMRMALFGVFDGHGSNGELVSDYAMWKVQELLLATADLNADTITQALIFAFEETDRLLATPEVNIAARASGAAAVVVVIIGNTLFVANAGDSRAVLAHTDTQSGAMVVTALTEDQKPDLPEEVRMHTHDNITQAAAPAFQPCAPLPSASVKCERQQLFVCCAGSAHLAHGWLREPSFAAAWTTAGVGCGRPGTRAGDEPLDWRPCV